MDDHPTPGDQQLLSITDAARRAGVSRQTIHMWLRHGYLTLAFADGPPMVRASALQHRMHLRKIASEFGITMATVQQWQGDRVFGDGDNGSP